MSRETRTRFRTGEKCARSGLYHCDGYLNGTSTPAPTAAEMEIELSSGETFPPIRSAKKGCWWKKAERV